MDLRLKYIFGIICEFWTLSIANMMYIRLQNYTNMMFDEHGIQTFNVVVVVLLLLWVSFDVFVPTSARPLLFLDKWFVQIYLNVSYDDFNQSKRGTF